MPFNRDCFTDVTAIVMAGGKSMRMGTDKIQLPIGGVTLIEHVLNQLRPHFEKILISSNNKDLLKKLDEEVVPDEKPNLGPVMGLISTVRRADTDICFVQACDIPETNMALLRELLNKSEGFDCVVPRDPKGRLEPLFAIYRKSAIKAMEYVMNHEGARAHMIMTHCKTRFVDLNDSSVLKNINTPDDYRSFIGN